MILPTREISENVAHYEFKSGIENSLKHQIKKLIFICNELEGLLRNHDERVEFYFIGDRQSYAIENLVNAYSVLIEYYFSWIILSHIGTISHKKIYYKPIKNTSLDIENRIEEIFKHHSIGVLKKTEDASFSGRCKQAFIEAFDFLFIGRFHELYEMNNFLKHNQVVASYTPRLNCKKSRTSIPFIYISKPFDSLLNKSTLKCFFDYQLDSNAKININTEDYFVDMFNRTSRNICHIGELKFYYVNGIEYVSTEYFSGVLVSSILGTSLDLCKNIIEKMVKSETWDGTGKTELNTLRTAIEKRKFRSLESMLD